jgi:ribosome-binding protein aMBF1 (putative translation factor)
VIPFPSSDWCARGHHKPTLGTIGKNRGCRVCHREARARWGRENQERIRRRKIERRAKRWGVPVQFVGAEAVYMSGEKLRATREALGLSREKLARLAGVSYGCIAHIELYGRRPMPRTQKRILDALAPLLAQRRRKLRELGAA